MGSSEVCFLCLSPGSKEVPLITCDHCKDVWACGPQHLNLHRGRRANICLPFRVTIAEDEPDKGRILVATRDIRPFDLVLEDQTSVFGPYDTNSSPVCVVCLHLIKAEEKCSKCALPLCKDNVECKESLLHQYECQVLSKSKVEDKVDYGALLPLRMLHCKSRDPELFGFLNDLQSHLAERKKRLSKDQSVIRSYDILAANPDLSKEDLDMLEEFSGKVKTNSLGYGSCRGVCYGHAIFPLFSLLCHCCMSNCRYAAAEVSVPNGHPIVVVQVRALKSVSKGQELSVQYKSALLGSVERRQAFSQNWLFDCKCARCVDPTELGSFLSGVRCQSCSEGYFLPASNMIEPWNCSHCSVRMSYEEVTAIVEELSVKMKSFAYFDPIEDWEELLSSMTKVLHPDHYLAMDVKRVLVQTYGSHPGSNLMQLSSKQLERKVSLCSNYLSVYSKVDPGYTKWRGRILEQLSGSELLLAKRRFARGDVDQAFFDTCVKTGLLRIQEAFKCRQYEFSIPATQLGALIKEFNDILAAKVDSQED